MSILLPILLSPLFSTPAAAYANPTYGQACETVTTCEVVGSHEECYYNRRGQLICNVIADQECTTELVCYDNENLGGGDCFYLVGYELDQCLQG